MGEQTANLTALMETLLSRFDEEKVLADKRAEAQTAFNNQVSQELQSLTKQIGLTQADVDDVRKVTSPSASSAPSSGSQVEDPSAAVLHTPGMRVGSQQQPPPPDPRTAPPPPDLRTAPPPPDPRTAPPPSALPFPLTITGQASTARLTNDGPPLLARPDGPRAPPERAPPPVLHEEYAVRPPKHQFPRFDGEAPRVWLDRCLVYFELYRVPLHNWVATAALYVDGHAALWLWAFRQTHGELTWDLFRQAVVEEFGPQEFESLMHKLLQLCQTGRDVEYRQQFEVYMYNLLALDATLSPKFFVTQFLLGLKDELRTAVRLQAPSSITRATVFARIQEEELEQQRPRVRQTVTGRPPPLPGRPPPSVGPATPGVPATRPALATASADDFGREHQL